MPTTPTDTTLLEPIEACLKTALLALEPARARRGRPQIVSTLMLWAGLLVCVARGFTAQLEVWRLLTLLTLTGLWDFPRIAVTEDAIYKRLKRAGPAVFQQLFAQVTAVVQAQRVCVPRGLENIATFATGLYVMDGVTLDALPKRLPILRQQAGTVLAGKVAAVFDLRAQLWHHLRFEAAALENDKVAARPLLETIPVGSLVLADLGYFAFAWFDTLTQQGYYWISRFRAKTSYTLIHTFYQREGVLDALVWLGAHRADRAAHPVRLVQFTHRGKTWRYLTNVLAPQQLPIAPIAHIAQLYARRWDIEMMFHLVKTHLHLHLLWSSQPSVIVHQVFAVFTIAQILLGLRADLAAQAQVDVFEVSLDLLIRWLPRFAREGRDPIQMLVEFGRQAKIIRPASRLTLRLPEIAVTEYQLLPAGPPPPRAPRYAGKK
jgi:hypothetical protein